MTEIEGAFLYWFENNHLGHGWRYVIVFDRTRGKRGKVSLLEPSTLALVRLPATALRQARPVELRPRSLARRMEERRRFYKRIGRRHPARQVKAIVDALRGMTRESGIGNQGS